MIAQAYLRGKPLGEMPGLSGASSYALFCAQCGEVWGRLVTSGKWDVIQRPCGKGHVGPYAGTFVFTLRWGGWMEPRQILEGSSPSLLEYELANLFRLYDQGLDYLGLRIDTVYKRDFIDGKDD